MTQGEATKRWSGNGERSTAEELPYGDRCRPQDRTGEKRPMGCQGLVTPSIAFGVVVGAIIAEYIS